MDYTVEAKEKWQKRLAKLKDAYNNLSIHDGRALIDLPEEITIIEEVVADFEQVEIEFDQTTNETL